VVDQTPPAAPAWTATEPVAGSGLATLTGTTEPFARVELYRSLTTATPVLTTQAGADGTFTFTGVAVQSGPNFFRVDAVDLAGNRSQTSGTFVSTDPNRTPPRISMHLAHDTGFDATDGLTNDPTVTGMVDTPGRIVAFAVSVNGSPFVGSLNSLKEGAF